METKTLYRTGYLVAYDAHRGSHVIHDGGELVLEGDCVVHAGGPYTGTADRVVDARDCLVSPGFINAHALMDVSIFQFAFDRPRERGYHRPRSWLEAPGEPGVFDPGEIRRGARLAFLNLARSGCTTIMGITSMVFKRWDDPPWEPEIYLEVAVESGLRAYLSHHYRSRAPYTGASGGKEFLSDEARGMEGLRRCVEFIEKYDGSFGGRIRGALFPYTLDQSTPRLLQATAEAAEELDVPVRMHTAQSTGEIDFLLGEHGMGPVPFLDELGVLGPRWLLTHCLHIAGNHPGTDESDLSILRDRGVSVANCPWIYTFDGGYLDSFSRYGRAGVNMCIGTDTFPQDILREMRWAATASKIAEGRGDAGTAREVFDAVTVNAARFLGREDIGRLCPGAKADVVMVDMERFSVGPVDDPIRALVYFATSADVKTVLVDGSPVVEDFRSLRFDEGQVVRSSRDVSSKIGDRLAAWREPDGDPSSVFSSSYPRVRHREG